MKKKITVLTIIFLIITVIFVMSFKTEILNYIL